MVIEATRIRVLDPTTEAVSSSMVLAPRVDDLNGKTVGLLANGKRNADKFLEAVAQLLGERYQVRQVLARNKGNASRPAPAEMLDELALQCDVVITGMGD